MSFKIQEIRIGENIYNLVPASSSCNNTFTILIGKNGCGKSRLLQKISNSFAVSDQLLREAPYRWIEVKKATEKSLTYDYFKYTVNDHNVDAEFIHDEIASSFFTDDYSKDYRDYFPSQVICLSTSPFDRFPQPFKHPLNRKESDFETQFPSIYTYIGLKDGSRVTTITTLINNVIQSLLSNPKRIQTNLDVIEETLSFLGYGNRFRFSLKNTLTEDDIETIETKSQLEKLIKTKIKNADKDLVNNIYSDNEEWYRSSSEIIKSLKSLYNHSDFYWKKNITTTIKLDSFIYGLEYLPDLCKLLKYGMLSINSFKLSQKNDNRKFIEFGEASSGEQCLTLMLLGIAGKIEDNSLICIDEPEISLHPDWQQKFISLLSSIYNRYDGCHFIIATHSPHIISDLKGDNSFILSMDENLLVSSDEYQNKSADYQLAKLFNTPGTQNEFINRLCVNLLCELSKNGKLSNDNMNNFHMLDKVSKDMNKDDNSYELIEIIRDSLSIIEAKL